MIRNSSRKGEACFPPFGPVISWRRFRERRMRNTRSTSRPMPSTPPTTPPTMLVFDGLDLAAGVGVTGVGGAHVELGQVYLPRK